MSEALRTVERVERTLVRCLVCGCSEVHTDEVFDHGWLLLAECPRCDHRWTRSDAPPARTIRARPAVHLRPEVASAA